MAWIAGCRLLLGTLIIIIIIMEFYFTFLLSCSSWGSKRRTKEGSRKRSICSSITEECHAKSVRWQGSVMEIQNWKGARPSQTTWNIERNCISYTSSFHCFRQKVKIIKEVTRIKVWNSCRLVAAIFSAQDSDFDIGNTEFFTYYSFPFI